MRKKSRVEKVPPERRMNAQVIIPAAGASERMGQPKPFLPYNEHYNFWQHIAHTYFNAGIRNIILVTRPGLKDRPNWKLPFAYKTVINPQHGKGRFLSVKKGIIACSGPFIFLQDIDRPFIPTELIWKLWKGRIKGGVTVPCRENKNGHPVLFSPEVVKAIETESNDNALLNLFLQKFRKKQVPVDHPGIHININSPSIYKHYFGKSPEVLNLKS